MINLWEQKWNHLKDEIEALKPYAANDIHMIRKIRKLKDEASIYKIAMEELRLGIEPEFVVAKMINDRKLTMGDLDV